MYFIKKSAIAQQLIEFIAFAGTDNVPVLAPQEADTEHLKDIVAAAELHGCYDERHNRQGQSAVPHL